jgi:signal transduction histidine kinase
MRGRIQGFLLLGLLVASPGGAVAQPQRWTERIAFWAAADVGGMRREIQMINRQLDRLPAVAGINTGNRIGYQSAGIASGEAPWIEVELPTATPLDRVVLLPLLAKGIGQQFPGFGFPRRFILTGFAEDDEEPLILLDETAETFPNPGCYPVTAEVPEGAALRRIRLTAVEPWRGDGPPVLALSEMMLLRGNRNMTAGAKFHASSSRELQPSWSRHNLLDMMTPLGLPLAPDRVPVMGWHSVVQQAQGIPQWVQVDLGEVRPIDEIRILPAWTQRMSWDNQYGFPARFLIEGSASGEDGSWFVIHDQTATTLVSPGRNLQVYKTIPKPLRYLRMTAIRLRARTGDYMFALSEMQAYQGDTNVALGAPVTASQSLIDEEWRPEGLTDGSAGGGRLLELPEWIHLLDQRKLLETRRVELEAELLSTLVSLEREVISGSAGGALALVLGVATFSWRGRRKRMLERERFRERLARDLHDEIGSNLGSIALISSLAGSENHEQMRVDLAEIEQVARESADSMRDMVSLIGARRGGPGNDWLEVLRDLASRSLRGIETDCSLPAAPLLWQPNLETRREIYLFCKEVLHNAIRHGRPGRVRFILQPCANGSLQIEISDNGVGFDTQQAPDGHGLGNLRERAAAMRAEMTLHSSPGAGTTVTLNIPRGRRWKKS